MIVFVEEYEILFVFQGFKFYFNICAKKNFFLERYIEATL